MTGPALYRLLNHLAHIGCTMEKSPPAFKFDFVTATTLLVTVLYAGFVLFPSYLNHDVSWIVYGAREMIKGGKFGVDVIDVNPPLTWWLSMPPVLVAELLNISPAVSFRLYVFLLIGIAIALLKRTNRQLETRQLAVAGMILIVMPGYDFGQREHLMAILVTPYLGNLINRDKNTPVPVPTRVIVGLMAGIGICIKPYFLLVPICVEIYRMAKTRNIFEIFRIETITMGLVGIVYVATAWFLAPAFFTDILPMVITNYVTYDNPVLLVARTLLLKSSMALLAVIILAFAGVRWGIGGGFFAAAVGAALSVLAQSKGWDYHILPVISFVLLAICLSVPPRKYAVAYFAGLVLFGLAVIPQPVRQTVQLVSPTGQYSLLSALTNRFSSLPVAQRNVFAFISSPRDIWPAMLASDARWTGAQGTLYLLPATVNNPENKKVKAIADRQLKAIVETLEQEKPTLILVNREKYQLGFRKPGFDYIKYLQQYPAYVSLFSGYREAESIGHFRVFEKVVP